MIVNNSDITNIHFMYTVSGCPKKVFLSNFVLNIILTDDGEGWEVVRRGRRSHGGSTASLNSSSQYQHHSHSNRDSRSLPLKEDSGESFDILFFSYRK